MYCVPLNVTCAVLMWRSFTYIFLNPVSCCRGSERLLEHELHGAGQFCSVWAEPAPADTGLSVQQIIGNIVVFQTTSLYRGGGKGWKCPSKCPENCRAQKMGLDLWVCSQQHHRGAGKRRRHGAGVTNGGFVAFTPNSFIFSPQSSLLFLSPARATAGLGVFSFLSDKICLLLMSETVPAWP